MRSAPTDTAPKQASPPSSHNVSLAHHGVQVSTHVSDHLSRRRGAQHLQLCRAFANLGDPVESDILDMSKTISVMLSFAATTSCSLATGVTAAESGEAPSGAIFGSRASSASSPGAARASIVTDMTSVHRPRAVDGGVRGCLVLKRLRKAALTPDLMPSAP